MTERNENESDAAYCFRLLGFHSGTPEYREGERMIHEEGQEEIVFRDGSKFLVPDEGGELQIWEPAEEDD